MADIKDLKETVDYLEQIKKALDEIKREDNINLIISVNGTPIEEFSGNLEDLDTGELINSLNAVLSNIDSMTTGNNESEESNEPTETSNRIEEFKKLINDLIAALQDKQSTAQVSQGQNSKQVQTSEQVSPNQDSELTGDSGSLDNFSDDDFDDIDNLNAFEYLGEDTGNQPKVSESDTTAQQPPEQVESDTEQPVPKVVEVPEQDGMPSGDSNNSEQPATKLSGEKLYRLKGLLNVLTKNLGNVSDLYISRADEKLSFTDKGFKVNKGYETVISVAGKDKTFDIGGYESDEDGNPRTPEEAAEEAIYQETGDNLPFDQVVIDMRNVLGSLDFFKEALDLAGVKLTDFNSLSTADADISEEEKEAAIYSKALKHLVDVATSSDKKNSNPEWEENLSNNSIAAAMLSAADTDRFAKFLDIREDAPEPVDTHKADTYNPRIDYFEKAMAAHKEDANKIRDDNSLTYNEKIEKLEPILASIDEENAAIEKLRDERDSILSAEYERYRNQDFQFHVRAFQDQNSEELNGAIAIGTDPDVDSKTRLASVKNVKSILKVTDNFLQKIGIKGNQKLLDSIERAQEFLEAYDIEDIRKRVKDGKDWASKFLQNLPMFEPTSDVKEPEKKSEKAEAELANNLPVIAKNIKLFEEALNREDAQIGGSDYTLLRLAKDNYAKLSGDANDNETGKSSAASSKGAARSPASDWLNQQTRRIQLADEGTLLGAPYTILEELLKEIHPQVDERFESGKLSGIKKSEHDSYIKAFNNAMKHINDAKKADKVATSEADLAKQRTSLTELEREINAYDINKLFPNLAEMPNEEKISVFEEAATATKKSSDKLLDYTDSSFKTQINRIRTTLNGRLREYQGAIRNLGGDTAKVDNVIVASKANEKEADKKSALAEITNEVRKSRTEYNEIRGTASPRELYEHIVKAIGNVNSKVGDAKEVDKSDDFGKEAEGKASAFIRDFSGLQSTKAVAAIKDFVDSNTDSIDQLVDALGNQEEAQRLPDTVPDYVKDIVAKSDSESEVGRSIIAQQKVIKDEQLKQDVANKQADVDTAKAQVQTAKGSYVTDSSIEALYDLANKQKELSDLYKAQGDTVKANNALLDSIASANEASKLQNDVPLELVALIKKLKDDFKFHEITATSDEKELEFKQADLKGFKDAIESADIDIADPTTWDAYREARDTANNDISKLQEKVNKDKLSSDLDDAQSEVAMARSQVQKARNNSSTIETVQSLNNLATTLDKVSSLFTEKGDNERATKINLESEAAKNEVLELQNGVPLELENLNEWLKNTFKDIEKAAITDKEKLEWQQKAILDYDNTIAASSGKYLPNENAKASYEKARDIANASLTKTQNKVSKGQTDSYIEAKQVEVDKAKEQVKNSKSKDDTEGTIEALGDLANSLEELSNLFKANGDLLKANRALQDSNSARKEADSLSSGVLLELVKARNTLDAEFKRIDATVIGTENKLREQQKAIVEFEKSVKANKINLEASPASMEYYKDARATAEKKIAQTQTGVYKQDLDSAKATVTNKKAVYDTISKADSGASTQDVIIANQEYIESLRALASLQEKYSNTDAVKESDLASTNASISKADAEAERLKTDVTREAIEQLKLFDQQLKQIQSDKTLSTADKAYYTQKVYQKAQDAYNDEKSRKDQMDVSPEGQAMPHTNEETLNAYKEFAEQAQKATTYLHQQSVEEERLAANTVQVKQQEQLISQSSNLGEKAQRTKELADIYRRQASYAKDLTEKETLLAKASKADADAIRLEQQAYQEFINNVKAIGKAVSDLGKSVQASINEIISLVRSGISVTNKYINTTVNGTRKVFSSTQRVIQLFGSLSNRVRQTASTFFNFARQTVSGLKRVGASLANLTSRFKTVIDRGNANPLKQSWTELNSAISLAQRAFNGVFNNELLNKAIKFDSTIASITMLLGDEATDNAQEFAKVLQDAFGMSYSRTISDLQEITSLLQSAGLQELGVSDEQIGKAAMDFYTISQYLAALGMAGGSATEVMSKLQSGMKGMTQSIDDLGLSVRESDMDQFLDKAKKAGKLKFDVKFTELSEANKEIVRLAAILDQFGKTKDIGNFKNLLTQPYYQVSLIKSRVEEIGTMVGKIFEGIIAKFLPAVITFLDIIQKVLGKLAGHLNIDLSGDKAQKSLSDISKAAGNTKNSLDGAKKSAKEFDGTAGFDEIESLNSSASDDDELNLSNLLSNVGSISGMFEQLAKDSLKHTSRVKRNFQNMIDSIVGHHVDLKFGFNKSLAKKQVKDIWNNIKKWWKAATGTGLYLSVRIAEDLKAGRVVNDVLRIVEALTRMGAVIAEYLDPIFRDFYEKHLSKYVKRASNSIHDFSLGMKQLADVVELIFNRKTSNSGIEKAIDNLAKKHPKLAKVAQDLYVLRDNFSGFFAIFRDNPIPDDLLKLNNLKKQFPILTQTLAILDAIVDLIRVLYKDYVTPLFDEIKSNFSLIDFLKGVETKIRDLTSLLDSANFQITVKDNFANLLQAAKTTLNNIKSVFSGTLTIGASLVKPTDSNGTVTSQANGGTSVASMAVDSYNKQSTELQGFLSSSADKASAYVTKHKEEIAGIINSILEQIEKQLELLITIIGKITQYLVEHPVFLERIAEMVTNILDYVNKNANTILWLLDTIVGFTFDNFNNLLNSLQLIFDYISNNKESVQEVLNMFTNFSGEALNYVAQIVISLFDYIAQHKEEIQSLMDKILTFLGWLADHPGVLITVFNLAVIGKVTSVLTTLLSPLGRLIKLLSDLYKFGKEKGIFQSIADGAKGLVGKAKGLFNFNKGATTAAEGVETLGIEMKSVPLLETKALPTTASNTTASLAGKRKGIFQSVADGAKGLAGKRKGIFQSVADGAKGLAGKAKSLFSFSKGATTASNATTSLAGTESLNVVAGGLTQVTALTSAAGIVAGITGAVKDAIDGVRKFTDESSTLGDKFAAGITSAVMSDESGLTGALKNGTKWGAVGAGIGTFIAPGIGTAIGGAIGAIGGAIAGAIDTESAIEKVKEIGSGIKEVGVSIKDQFGNSMKDSIKTITSDAATIPQKIGAAVNIAAKIFGGLPVTVFSIGKKLVTALCQNESIQKAFTSARNFATKLWDAAPKIFGAIGSRIANAFKPMGNAIGGIFKGVKDKATKAFNFVANKVGGFVSNVFDGASDLVDRAESALGIEPEEKKSLPKTYSTSTPVNDPRSAGVASTRGSASYKGLNASNKSSANSVLANYSTGKISKAAANAKLKKISPNLYIRKLGGTVPTGQMFIANEPGNPEYIGKVGTHTAVANNTMITEAMETAIYNGLVDAWNQRASSTANRSSEVNVNLSGFGLIDKQTLRRLAQMLAPYFEANAKSFRTV